MSRLGAAPASLAQLYASIAACEATHVSVLGARIGRPVTTPRGEIAALQGALAAEHAAVYGYGVVGAMLGRAPQQAAARAPTGRRTRSPGTPWRRC